MRTLSAREMARELHRSMVPGRRGMALVLSAPSGAGKSTLISRIMATEGRSIERSVSATTRARRGAEVDGIDYGFVGVEAFAAMRDAGMLIEHAEVHGNLYGTRRAPVEAALSRGRDVILDVDWQGAEQIRAALGRDVVSVFVLPPSIAELRRRLVGRAEDESGTIERRIAAAKGEIGKCGAFDYVLVNEDVEETCAMLCAIVATERLRAFRTVERTADLLLSMTD